MHVVVAVATTLPPSQPADQAPSRQPGAVLEETEVIGAYLERLEAFLGRARLGGAEAVLARDGADVF